MDRKLLVGGLHLGVLWAFAVVQPLLDLLGDNPTSSSPAAIRAATSCCWPWG